MDTIKKPLVFKPFFKETIWGGHAIAALKGNSAPSDEKIGESWEIGSVAGCDSQLVDKTSSETVSELCREYGADFLGENVIKQYGKTFPLLVKIIDANDALSLQVHPDDEMAREIAPDQAGKTEMWYVLNTSEGAKIHAGLSKTITPEDYDRLTADGRLMDVVRTYNSKPGDTFFLPAGQLHAIGAGNIIVEIQQSSDLTFRVDDYGRLGNDGKPRELHTELARRAINYSSDFTCLVDPKVDADKTRHLVNSRYFNVDIIENTGETERKTVGGSFVIMVCISGNGTVSVGENSVDIAVGHTLLLPACVDSYKLKGNVSFLTAYVPKN